MEIKKEKLTTAAKTPYYMILRRAFKMYVDRFRYAYFYGAKGEILTEKKMNELIAAYPNYWSRFSPQAVEEIKRYSKGKTGYDCSGFLTAITGIPGYSGALYDKTVDKTTVVNGKAGYMLYKTGHCGVDIGYGYAMHIGSAGNTIEIAKIQTIGFDRSGAFPGYDYTGSNNN